MALSKAFDVVETTIGAIHAAYRAGNLDRQEPGADSISIGSPSTTSKEPAINSTDLAQSQRHWKTRIGSMRRSRPPAWWVRSMAFRSSVKDQADVREMPTTLGSSLFKDYTAGARMLRRSTSCAGPALIFLGKSTLGELGGGDTHGIAVRLDAQRLRPRAHGGRLLGRLGRQRVGEFLHGRQSARKVLRRSAGRRSGTASPAFRQHRAGRAPAPRSSCRPATRWSRRSAAALETLRNKARRRLPAGLRPCVGPDPPGGPTPTSPCTASMAPDPRFPRGDHGGNTFPLRWPADPRRQPAHPVGRRPRPLPQLAPGEDWRAAHLDGRPASWPGGCRRRRCRPGSSAIHGPGRSKATGSLWR